MSVVIKEYYELEYKEKLEQYKTILDYIRNTCDSLNEQENIFIFGSFGRWLLDPSSSNTDDVSKLPKNVNDIDILVNGYEIYDVCDCNDLGNKLEQLGFEYDEIYKDTDNCYSNLYGYIYSYSKKINNIPVQIIHTRNASNTSEDDKYPLINLYNPMIIDIGECNIKLFPTLM